MKAAKLATPVAIRILLLSISCAGPAAETPRVATPTPPPTPTLVTIPGEILASHFGIVGVRLDIISEITGLGIRWEKPFINPTGPFVWGLIEPEKGGYIWREVDEYVERVQSHNMAILATIWAFAERDQANWGPVGDDRPLIFESWLGRSRRKPYDTDAY